MGNTTEFSFLSCLRLCGVISPSSIRLNKRGVKGQTPTLSHTLTHTDLCVLFQATLFTERGKVWPYCKWQVLSKKVLHKHTVPLPSLAQTCTYNSTVYLNFQTECPEIEAWFYTPTYRNLGSPGCNWHCFYVTCGDVVDWQTVSGATDKFYLEHTSDLKKCRVTLWCEAILCRISLSASGARQWCGGECLEAEW